MLPVLALVAHAEAPAPAMVTTVRGAVTLVEAGAKKPAPAPPFLLAPGAALELAAGAHVVLLRQGGAFAVDGPKTVEAEALRPPATATADTVGELLSRRTSLASAGASRAGGLAMIRPVPDTKVVALAEVRWRCDACGRQKVEVLDLRSGASVWTGEGDGRVAYTGEKLHPGPWIAKVGGAEFKFLVAAPEEAAAVGRAPAGLDALAPDDRAQALAAWYLLAGFPTEALALAEQAGVAASFEQAIGL